MFGWFGRKQPKRPSARITEFEASQMFRFQPRWKEELIVEVVGGTEGAFMLEIVGSPVTVYLPTEPVWRARVPRWAQELWPQLHMELQSWCAEKRITLIVEPSARVY